MARPDSTKQPQSYNNFAMDSLMGPGDDGNASPSSPTKSLSLSPSGPAAAAPPPPAQNQGISISKVPGGFQVSAVVGSMAEANEIASKFMAPSGEEAEGAEGQGEGEGEGSSEGEGDGSSLMDTMSGGGDGGGEES